MDTVQAAFILECKVLNQVRKTEGYQVQMAYLHKILDLDWTKYKGWSVSEIQKDWEALCQKNVRIQ